MPQGLDGGGGGGGEDQGLGPALPPPWAHVGVTCRGAGQKERSEEAVARGAFSFFYVIQPSLPAVKLVQTKRRLVRTGQSSPLLRPLPSGSRLTDGEHSDLSSTCASVFYTHVVAFPACGIACVLRLLALLNSMLRTCQGTWIDLVFGTTT